jgi:hypothetical protein
MYLTVLSYSDEDYPTSELTVTRLARVYCIIILLLYQAFFLELFRLTTCIFSEIIISRCISRAIMYNNGSIEESSVETMARDGKCHIFPVEFSVDILSMKIFLCVQSASASFFDSVESKSIANITTRQRGPYSTYQKQALLIFDADRPTTGIHDKRRRDGARRTRHGSEDWFMGWLELHQEVLFYVIRIVWCDGDGTHYWFWVRILIA